MDLFLKFDAASWSLDDSNRSMTREGRTGWERINCQVPIITYGLGKNCRRKANVHEWEITIVRSRRMMIAFGIVPGIGNVHGPIGYTSGSYILYGDGAFWELGILHSLSKCQQSFIFVNMLLSRFDVLLNGCPPQAQFLVIVA